MTAQRTACEHQWMQQAVQIPLKSAHSVVALSAQKSSLRTALINRCVAPG